MRQRRTRAIIVAVAALLLLQVTAVLIYLGVSRRRAETPSRFAYERLAGTQVAPEVVLQRADGASASIRDHRGRPVLIHFWATWCPPCIEELPGLLALAAELRGEISLLAISVDDDWRVVSKFFGGNIPAEVHRAIDPEAHRSYGVSVLPDTYLTNAAGGLVARYGGARNWRSKGARTHLREMTMERRP